MQKLKWLDVATIAKEKKKEEKVEKLNIRIMTKDTKTSTAYVALLNSGLIALIKEKGYKKMQFGYILGKDEANDVLGIRFSKAEAEKDELQYVSLENKKQEGEVRKQITITRFVESFHEVGVTVPINTAIEFELSKENKNTYFAELVKENDASEGTNDKIDKAVNDSKEEESTKSVASVEDVTEDETEVTDVEAGVTEDEAAETQEEFVAEVTEDETEVTEDEVAETQEEFVAEVTEDEVVEAQEELVTEDEVVETQEEFVAEVTEEPAVQQEPVAQEEPAVQEEEVVQEKPKKRGRRKAVAFDV